MKEQMSGKVVLYLPTPVRQVVLPNINPPRTQIKIDWSTGGVLDPVELSRVRTALHRTRGIDNIEEAQMFKVKLAWPEGGLERFIQRVIRLMRQFKERYPDGEVLFIKDFADRGIYCFTTNIMMRRIRR